MRAPQQVIKKQKDNDKEGRKTPLFTIYLSIATIIISAAILPSAFLVSQAPKYLLTCQLPL